MSRSRASARSAGARFERSVADYLAAHVDDRIDRRPKYGSKDRGDLGGLRGPYGQRLVVEVKDCARLQLAAWAAEAEVERGNDDAVAGLIVHKRHGVADPAGQWVTCTLADLVAVLTGTRPAERHPAAPGLPARLVTGTDPVSSGRFAVAAGDRTDKPRGAA